jgi:hypothetical protein
MPTVPERLNQLNTKAYYLLVALSFLYSRSAATISLKWAITLTAFAAVLPVQDYVTQKSMWLSHVFRWFKVIALTTALGFTMYWLWSGPNSSKGNENTFPTHHSFAR